MSDDGSSTERLLRLERENAMLKAAIRASPAGILIASAPDGVIEHWNPAALGIRGESAEALTKIPVSQHPERWQTFHPNGEIYRSEDLPLSRALLRGETVDGDDVIIRDQDGSERWVLGHAAPVYNDDGELVAGVVVFPDITRRKHAELDANRFRRMAELSPDFVGIASPEGRPLYVNPAGREMCGIPDTPPPDDMRVIHLYAEASRAKILEVALPAALRDGVWRGETELLRPDGTTVPVSQVLIAHRDDNGEVVFLSTVMRDLRPIRELQSQLSQRQRLEAVGSLAGGIAHDFNNLLTVINNYAELIAETLDASDPNREDLAQITLASQRAGALCHKLLSFARRQIIRPEVLQVDVIVRELLGLLTRTLGEDIVLTIDLAEDLWPIEVDRSQLDQVLMNLVVNARDAMPDGGDLTIEAHNVELDAHYCETAPNVTPGPYVRLAVSDSGHGIPPEVQERVFEPFFTTKASMGNGLGLATVHGAVRQNRGHIWLYSEEGRGTTFKIYWPRAEGTPDLIPSDVSTAPHRGSGKLLVVEDDPSLRALTVRLLRSAGFEILSASDGREALRLSATHHEHIDLLITDVIMPRMNGRELAQRLERRRPGLRTLYVSGYTENTIVHRGVLDADVEHFLPKPFTREALLNAVNRALERESAT